MAHHHAPQSYSHVPKGSSRDTTSSVTGGNFDERRIIARDVDCRMVDIGSIAPNGQVTAIKYRSVGNVKSVSTPIDIRLVSWITALLSQRLLPRPREIPVPE